MTAPAPDRPAGSTASTAGPPVSPGVDGVAGSRESGPVSRHARAAGLVARALVAASLVVGAVQLPGELLGMGRASQRLAALPRDHGQVAHRAFDGPRLGFLEFVRRTVPPGERVRIAEPGRDDPALPVVCEGSPSRAGERFWFVYSTVPRPRTCDPAARWTVYLGVRPVRVPPGARVHSYSPDLVVVESPGGRP